MESGHALDSLILSHFLRQTDIHFAGKCSRQPSQETRKETDMRTFALAALLSLFALGSMADMAVAEDTCQSKAVDKNGKPLAGAAKDSFIKKCMKDTCEAKAVDKNGKALAGAAKDSFMKKCQSAS
jgi:hypothetical protein